MAYCEKCNKLYDWCDCENIMNKEKIYHDSEGNKCSILRAVRREPEWAASRIQVGETAIEMVEKLELELRKIRDLLSAQHDKECLGTGYPDNPDDCSPWPIVDEVISSITTALSGT